MTPEELKKGNLLAKSISALKKEIEMWKNDFESPANLAHYNTLIGKEYASGINSRISRDVFEKIKAEILYDLHKTLKEKETEFDNLGCTGQDHEDLIERFCELAEKYSKTVDQLVAFQITDIEGSEFLHKEELEEIKNVKATVIVRNLSDYIHQLTDKVQELEAK